MRQSSKLGAWNHVLLYVMCEERMIGGMVLDEILIPEFVEQILASVFLQRLSITVLTLTERVTGSITDLHVVEDGVSQLEKVTLVKVEHVHGSPPVTPCELATSELGRARLMR